MSSTGLMVLPNELLVMIAEYIGGAAEGKSWRLTCMACYQAAYQKSDFWMKCGAARRMFRHYYSRYRLLGLQQHRVQRINDAPLSLCKDFQRLSRTHENRPLRWTVSDMKVNCINEWADTGKPHNLPYAQDVLLADGSLEVAKARNIVDISRFGDVVLAVEITFVGFLKQIHLEISNNRIWTWNVGLRSRDLNTPRTIRRDFPTPLTIVSTVYSGRTIEVIFEKDVNLIPSKQWTARLRWVFLDDILRQYLCSHSFRDGKLFYGGGTLRMKAGPRAPGFQDDANAWCKGPPSGGGVCSCGCCWQYEEPDPWKSLHDANRGIVPVISMHDVAWAMTHV